MFSLLFVGILVTGSVTGKSIYEHVFNTDSCYHIEPAFESGKGIRQPEAKAACESEGTSLFEYETSEEFELVRLWIRENDAYNIREKYWVGAIKDIANDIWIWDESGEVVPNELLLWGEDEPNNLGGDEYCTNLLKKRDYYLNDARCRRKMGYVCKKKVLDEDAPEEWTTVPTSQMPKLQNQLICMGRRITEKAPLDMKHAGQGVDNSYLVALFVNDDDDFISKSIQASVQLTFNGKIGLGDVTMLDVEITDNAELEKLRENRNVAFIEQNGIQGIDGTCSQTPPITWGLDRIDQKVGTNEKYQYYCPTAPSSAAAASNSGGTIVIYEHDNYIGGSRSYASTSFLGDFNDRTSSIKILGSACWQIYEHGPGSGGRSQTLAPGNYPNPFTFNIGNDALSTVVKETCDAINLYENDNFGGAVRTFTGTTTNVGVFNDMTTSIEVLGEACWAIYEHGPGAGLYQYLLPGRYTLDQIIIGNDALTDIAKVDCASANLALSKPAYQSSKRLGTNDPRRGVDGNSNPSWYGNSCTHTNLETNPWWVVDLKKSYTVSNLVITNRGDCCSSRLNNFYVGVGDSFSAGAFNPLSFPKCKANPTTVGSSVTIPVQCDQPIEGRYVSVYIISNSRVLTLCEVEVYGVPAATTPVLTNLAQGQPTWQKSSGWGGYSPRATDGNVNTNWYGNSCTHTRGDTSPWWTVDLQGTYSIQRVAVYNRADCCSYRLNNFYVGVGDSFSSTNFNPQSYSLCKAAPTTANSGGLYNVQCDQPVNGRYVTVYVLGSSRILTLCEVEVFGVQPASEDPEPVEVEPVDVYVIDTGVADLPDFGGRLFQGWSEFGNPADSFNDVDGHGTHVAGTVASNTYGVSKTANIYAVRVLGDQGRGSMAGIARGIDWARANMAQNQKPRRTVINMSLSGPGPSPAITAAVDALVDAGAAVVVAAGNSAFDACRRSPAEVPSAITVACSNSADNMCSFSNFGPCVDIYAPGRDITSWQPNGTPRTISGTSMSTPHVAGAISQWLLENDGALTTAQVVNNKLANEMTIGEIKNPGNTINKLLRAH